MTNNFALDYIDVATRIVEFRGQYPNGSLQQVSIDFREFGGKSWVIFTAAAYRTPDDQRPGIGTAWEPVPGRTPFTRDSEVQNAETAAWGRAIVAALAGDTKRGIASAEEVRNRSAERDQPAASGQRRSQLLGMITNLAVERKAQIAGDWLQQHGHPINETEDLDALQVLVESIVNEDQETAE